MSKSRLGESLLKTIEGGKRPDIETDSIELSDEFEQARTAEEKNEFEESTLAGSSSTTDSDSTEHVHREQVISLHADKQDFQREKPSRVNSRKANSSVSRIGVLALLVSLLSISVGGYSVFSQKKLIASNEINRDSVEQAIGSLTTKTDGLTADVSEAKQDIASSRDEISNIDRQLADINDMKSNIEVIRIQMNEMKNKIDSNAKSIREQELTIASTKESIDMLSNRVTIQRQPARTVQHTPTNTTTTSSVLEGASVASIDTWGTHAYVMLKDSDGNWLPLSHGDYFKGWRLEGTVDGVAVFRRGDKTTRVIVEQ